MTEHLKQEQLEGYRRKRLNGAALMAVLEHAAECAECRGRLSAGMAGEEAAGGAVAALQGLGEEHLEYEELKELMEPGCGAELRARAEAHLAECESCRGDWDDLRGFAAKVEPARVVEMPRRRTWQWVAAAAAAAAVIAIVSWKGTPQAEVAQRMEPALQVALVDGGVKIGLDAQGGWHGRGELGGEERALVERVVRTGSVSLNVPNDVLSPRGVLMGAAEGEKLHVVTPAGETVVSDRPTLRWTAAAGAEYYEVEIYDGGFRKVAGSGRMKGLEWQPEKGLERGVVYFWQVSARTGKGVVRAPEPPNPEARFRVLGKEEAEAIEGMRAKAGYSRVLAAAKLAEAGARAEARMELEKLAEENPGSELAGRLKAGLQ